MSTRVFFEDPDDAEEAAQVVSDADHEVAVINERFDGEDDAGQVYYVVATSADEDDVRDLLDLDEDAWVETD